MSDTISLRGRRLRGYPITFGKKSLDLGGFVEEIHRSAMDRTLSEKPDLRALVGHNADMLIGRTASKTMTYNVDSRGMHVEIDPPATATGNEVVELVRRRDLDGMSFAFTALDDDFRLEGSQVVRTVRDLRLREISVVTWPAYPSTSIDVAERSTYRSGDDSAVERWGVGNLREKHAADVAKAKRLASKARCEYCPTIRRGEPVGAAVTVRQNRFMCETCLRYYGEVQHRTLHPQTAPTRGRGTMSVAFAERLLKSAMTPGRTRTRKEIDCILRLAR